MDPPRNPSPETRETSGATPTYRFSRPPYWVTCARDVPRDLAESWLAEHGSWFADDETRVRRLSTVELPPGAVSRSAAATATVKPETVPLSRSLRHAFRARPARSAQAFRLGIALAQAGVRAPRPLAVIESRRRGLGLIRRSCLIMETVDGVTLRDYLLARTSSASASSDPAAWKSPLWRAIASAVARLHAAGFRQRDLKASNLMVVEREDPLVHAEPEIHLVDLEGMTQLGAPPAGRVRQRDLARLLVSLRAVARRAPGHPAAPGESDWEEFIGLYLDETRGASPRADELREYLRVTAQWAERKERRNRRRRRPLG